jgi:hypothetical protein
MSDTKNIFVGLLRHDIEFYLENLITENLNMDLVSKSIETSINSMNIDSVLLGISPQDLCTEQSSKSGVSVYWKWPKWPKLPSLPIPCEVQKIAIAVALIAFIVGFPPGTVLIGVTGPGGIVITDALLKAAVTVGGVAAVAKILCSQ